MVGRQLHLALLALLALGLAGPAHAVGGEPMEQLRERMEQVVRALQDPALQGDARAHERREAVGRIAQAIFDYPESARLSLGSHWASRTAAEREEFVRLFTALFEHSYVSKVDILNSERVSYTGETIQGDTATVRTLIVTRQSSEIPVDYRMLRRGGHWLVYDVLIDGVSLVANYRSQFNKIIQTSSYQELVRKLRTKRAELEGSRS